MLPFLQNQFTTFKKTINMKPFAITCCFALLLVFAACNDTPTEDATATKTDSPATAAAETPPPPRPDSATAAKNWQDYMTPGDMHKMMASWNGKWKTDMTVWMEPGKDPQKTTGTGENKMIMNGLYQTSTYKSNMMGMAFEGLSTTGYDKHKKVFEATWVDNMGSGIMKMSGPWDEANKTITLTGKMTDPASGQEMDYKQIMKVVDDNTHVMEMFGPGPYMEIGRASCRERV